jgi:hypothetical protein
MKRRDFKGVFVPTNIWLHNELSSDEKMLVMEIDQHNSFGCDLPNEHFESLLHCGSNKVNQLILKLIDLKLLVLVQRKPRVLTSTLSESNTQLLALKVDPKPTAKEETVVDSWYKDFVQMANRAFGKQYRGSDVSRKQFQLLIKKKYRIYDFQRVIESVRRDEYHIKHAFNLASLEHLTNESFFIKFLNHSIVEPIKS